MPQSTMSMDSSGTAAKSNLLLELTPQEQLLTKSVTQQVEHTLFLFAHAVQKQSKFSTRWTHAAFFITAAQMLSFMLSAHYGWDGVVEPLANFLSIFAVSHRANPFGTYMFMLWGCAATVAVASAFAAFHIRMLAKSETAAPPVWAQRSLQLAAHLIPGILFLPFLLTMALVYRCHDFGEKSVLSAVDDTHIECWDLEHITYVVISAPCLLLLGIFAFCFNSILFEFNPNSDIVSSRMNSRADLVSFVLKIGVVACQLFFDDRIWVGWLSLFVWSLSMGFLNIVMQPYYRPRVNHQRSGVYMSLFFVSSCLGLNLLLDSSQRKPIAILMYAGIIPSVYFGRKVSAVRAKLLHEKFTKETGELSARSDEPPEGQPGQAWSKEEANNPNRPLIPMRQMLLPRNWKHLLVAFPCPLDGAIAAREICVKEKAAGRLVAPSRDEIDKADDIFTDELEKHPDSILLLLAYMNFLNYFAHQADKFRIHGDKLNLLEPAIDIRFIVYRSSKELDQQRQSDSTGTNSMDLASYIEFQNSYKEARKYHSEALKSIRRFWTLLLVDDEKFDLEQLPQAAKHINTATSAAQYHYESLLRRHPESTRLFRAYAEFLLGTSHDARRANAFLRKADELEDLQARRRTEERKQGGLGSNFNTNIDMDDKTRAIITIDGKGIIQNINHTCSKMLQYSKAEVVGANLKMLMPSPYSENHDTYLANYHRTGVKKVLGSVRSLDAKAKNGDLIPIRLSVHQTDVNGQVFFVGMLERQDDSSCVLSVQPTGVIMNCNQIFPKKFGRETRELAGRNFGEFFGNQSSESSLGPINFEEVYGSSESIKLHGHHGDGRFIQVIMSPKKVTRDGSTHYRCVFEFLDEIEVMITIDIGGIIRSSNHFVSHVFGFTKDDIVGEKINMLMPEPYRTFHDTYLQTYAHTGIKNVLDSSRVVEGQHKDGSKFKLHLLVSEGEVNGGKVFSARATFARKTEIPTCRLTITGAGVITNHSETAVKMFEPFPQITGVALQKLVRFTSPKLDQVPFLDALRSQCGQGPTSVYLSSAVTKGSERRDLSMEVLQQDLNGDTFFIARFFDTDGADVTATATPEGELLTFNDLLPHLLGIPTAQMAGKNMGNFLRPSNSKQQSFALNTSESATDEASPTNFLDYLGVRTNALCKHRDESSLPIYFEVSHIGDKINFRIARRAVPRSASTLQDEERETSSAGRQEKTSEEYLQMEMNEINENEPDDDDVASDTPLRRRGTPPGVSFAGPNETEDDDSTPSVKKKVKMDGEEGGSDHESSEGGSSSHVESNASSVRRVQKLRRKYQQSNHQNKSIVDLRRKVIIGLLVLIGLALGLYGGITILATSQVSAGFSVSLCGNAILFHRNIYLYLNSIITSPVCEPNCPWNATMLYKQLGHETDALENAFMALYMKEDISLVYEQTKEYVYYDKPLSPYSKAASASDNFASDTLKELFVSTEIPLREMTDVGAIDSKSPFIRAVRTYIFYSRFLSVPKNWNDPLVDRYIYFIKTNGPDSIGDNWNKILSEYHSLSSVHSDELQLIQSLVVAIALVLLFGLGIFVLRPSFSKVHEERFNALRLFLLIPKAVVRTLSKIRITLESSGSGSENSDGEEQIDDGDDNMEEGGARKGRSNSNKKDPDSISKGHIFSVMKNRKIKEEKKKLAKQYVEAVPEEGVDVNAPLKSSLVTRFKLWSKSRFDAITTRMKIRPITKKWLSILFLLSLCFGAATIYGILVTKTSASAATLVYYSSQLSSLAQDISYYTIELTDSPVGNSEQQKRLSSAIDNFKLRLDCITHGCDEFGISRSDNDGNHASLYYSNQCFFKDPNFCLKPADNLYELSVTGVVNIATEFSRSANAMSLLSNTIPLNSTDFEIVVRGQQVLLRTGFASVIDNYTDELDTSTSSLKKGQGIIAGVTSAFIALSFFIFFRPMFHSLQEENRQTKAMLLMIPDEVVANTKEIELFITSTDS
eukprot:TRINITY_DN9175_c0_g1_i1.p1 TRINITY_DN9175_c0_g1~~TRINITY_DN9175_c0_g1_i1.p1  ORF type:complete len:1966 (-),score=384.65 TRINITY_DN9175_c0_g1_i1:1331-7228(-)